MSKVTKTNNLYSQFRFGVINSAMIVRGKFSKNARLVYGTIRAAQGMLPYVKTNQKEIAAAIGISTRSVKAACKDLRDGGYLKYYEDTRGLYNCPVVDTSTTWHGFVELDFLVSPEFTPNEKAVYLFYAAVNNSDKGYSHWNKEDTQKAVGMTARTFYPVRDSLIAKGALHIEEGGKGKNCISAKVATRVIIARLKNVEIAPSKYFNTLSKHTDNEESEVFKFPVIRKAPVSEGASFAYEGADFTQQKGKNCKLGGAENTTNKKNNKKKYKNNNTGKGIIISESTKSAFELIWSIYERGDKDTSLEAFAKLETREYNILEDMLESSNGTYYSILINRIIDERKPAVKKTVAQISKDKALHDKLAKLPAHQRL